MDEVDGRPYGFDRDCFFRHTDEVGVCYKGYDDTEKVRWTGCLCGTDNCNRNCFATACKNMTEADPIPEILFPELGGISTYTQKCTAVCSSNKANLL